MAILDTSKKPYIQDRNTDVFVGIDYPVNRSEGPAGWFSGTETTIDAVKTNIRLLLSTEKGERLMQPNLGLNLRRYLFEQFTDDLAIGVQNEILNTIKFWMPFVEVRDIQVSMSDENRGTMKIQVMFNITKSPNTLESVEIEIGD